MASKRTKKNGTKRNSEKDSQQSNPEAFNPSKVKTVSMKKLPSLSLLNRQHASNRSEDKQITTTNDRHYLIEQLSQQEGGQSTISDQVGGESGELPTQLDSPPQINQAISEQNSAANMGNTIEKGEKAFSNLENEFQSILSKLSSDEHLESFRAEYKKLHNTLVKSHQNEVRLIRKCHALNQEIISNASKVAMAIKLSEEDQKTIKQLRSELSKAWKMVEQTVESDSQSQREIERLTRELNSAEGIIERYRGTGDQLEYISKLETDNRELLSQRDRMTERIQELYTEYDNAREKCYELEAKIAESTQEVKSYRTETQIAKREHEKMDRHRKVLQNSVTEQKQKMLDMESDMTAHVDKILEYQQLVDAHKATIREKMEIIAQKDKEIQASNLEAKKYEKQFKKVVQDQTTLSAEKRKQQLEFEMLKQENNTLQNSIRNLKKDKSKSDIELRKTQDIHSTDKEYIKELQLEIDSLKSKIQEQNRKAHSDSTTIQSLRQKVKKEKESKMEVASLVLKEQENVRLSKQHVDKLKEHVQEWKKNTSVLKNETFHLHVAKEKSLEKNHDLQYKYDQLKEELSLLKLENQEHKRSVNEMNKKLAAQRARYEQVRSDRTVTLFRLRQSEDLISEQQKKMNFTKQQTEQLKNEIIGCEKRITSLNQEKETMLKQKTQLNTTVADKTQSIKDLKSRMTTLQNENEKLRQMMREGDVVRTFEQIRFNDIVRDRDLLGTQLIKRNDHISYLKKKIRIQQSIIEKGSVQYRQKEEDLHSLLLKIKELEFKLGVYQKRSTHKAALKEVVTAKEKENKDLKTQVKALSQQLDKPNNVHSWRLISAKDESKHELMIKTQWLQKQLLLKRQELFDVQHELVEKDRVCTELRKKFKRLPGADVQHQLSRYEDQVRKLKEKLRATTGEMNMYAYQVKEHQSLRPKQKTSFHMRSSIPLTRNVRSVHR